MDLFIVGLTVFKLVAIWEIYMCVLLPVQIKEQDAKDVLNFFTMLKVKNYIYELLGVIEMCVVKT